MVQTAEARRLTAYHESGHALVALNTRGATPVHKATIVPRGHALGMVSMVPHQDEYSTTKQQMLASIDVCMGGKAAEELIFGEDQVLLARGADCCPVPLTAGAEGLGSAGDLGRDQRPDERHPAGAPHGHGVRHELPDRAYVRAHREVGRGEEDDRLGGRPAAQGGVRARHQDAGKPTCPPVFCPDREQSLKGGRPQLCPCEGWTRFST